MQIVGYPCPSLARFHLRRAFYITFFLVLRVFPFNYFARNELPLIRLPLRQTALSIRAHAERELDQHRKRDVLHI